MFMKIIVAVLLLGSLTGCGGASSDARASGGGSCDEGAAFSRSMASSGGEANPQAALDAAAAENPSNYPFDIPTDGWEAVSDAGRQQTSRAGDVELTVLQLEDGTWAVESGRCVSG